ATNRPDSRTEPRRAALTGGAGPFFRKLLSSRTAPNADESGTGGRVMRTDATGAPSGAAPAAPSILPGRGVMRRLVLLARLLLGRSNTGCFWINQYPSDENQRMDALLNQSEDLRQVQGAWRRTWFNDMPSHLTPERVHGGIVP